MHFNMVLGVNGGISATPRDLTFMVDSLPEGSSFTVCAMGRYQMDMTTLSVIMGGHVRVGFEDNLYVSKGVLAKSNGELVEKIVRIIHELGREIATPAESRQMLGLKPF